MMGWFALGSKVLAELGVSAPSEFIGDVDIILMRSEVKERMKKTKADKQAQKASQPKGGAKATKVMPKGGPGGKGGKR